MFKFIRPCVAILAAVLAPSIYAADLRVEVLGITHADGKIMIALFDQAEGFPRRRAKGLMLDATLPAASGVFTDLPQGKYAVSVYHDENGNGKLDTNFMRMPTEHYGFSRNAMGRMGPPKFADAAVNLDSEDLSIVINLQ